MARRKPKMNKGHVYVPQIFVIKVTNHNTCDIKT